MTSTTVDYRNTVFEHPTLTRIHGEPTFEGIHHLHKELMINAQTVHSDLGGGTHGHLGLVLSPQRYPLIRNAAYTPPPTSRSIGHSSGNNATYCQNHERLTHWMSPHLLRSNWDGTSAQATDSGGSGSSVHRSPSQSNYWTNSSSSCWYYSSSVPGLWQGHPTNFIRTRAEGPTTSLWPTTSNQRCVYGYQWARQLFWSGTNALYTGPMHQFGISNFKQNVIFSKGDYRLEYQAQSPKNLDKLQDSIQSSSSTTQGNHNISGTQFYVSCQFCQRDSPRTTYRTPQQQQHNFSSINAAGHCIGHHSQWHQWQFNYLSIAIRNCSSQRICTRRATTNIPTVSSSITAILSPLPYPSQHPGAQYYPYAQQMAPPQPPNAPPNIANISSTPGSAHTKRKKMSYCWTHGGCYHRGAQCRNKAPGHMDSATFNNRLGGSTRNVQGIPPSQPQADTNTWRVGMTSHKIFK